MTTKVKEVHPAITELQSFAEPLRVLTQYDPNSLNHALLWTLILNQAGVTPTAAIGAWTRTRATSDDTESQKLIKALSELIGGKQGG